MMKSFMKNGFLCKVERDINEPYEHFLYRGIFMTSQMPKNNSDYNKYIVYSRISSNIKFKKCEYSKEIMEEVSKMEEKMYCE